MNFNTIDLAVAVVLAFAFNSIASLGAWVLCWGWEKGKSIEEAGWLRSMDFPLSWRRKAQVMALWRLAEGWVTSLSHSRKLITPNPQALIT